jgi:hypothetical protein
MQGELSWLTTTNSIVINFDGQTHIVPNKGDIAEKLIVALKAKDENEISNLVDAAARLEKESGGLFKAKDGQIEANGETVHRSVEQKIAEFMAEGLPYEPLKNFLEKVNQNPSQRARHELYAFLEKNNHPITETGNFIGYRRVRDDFKDIYSGKFDNSPGQICSMPREQVDDDPTRTCSKGLHVANWYYAHDCYGGGGGVMLEVEINPKDVVAVPIDYEGSKMRVCEFKVLRVVDQENSSTTLTNVSSASKALPLEMTCQECGVELVSGEDEICVDCEDSQ